MRRAQLSFGDGLIAGEAKDLRESWMNRADRLLDDETIVATVYEALGRRHPKSRSRGRRGAPAEMALRLLILKHVRTWSYEVLEREVRANRGSSRRPDHGGGPMKPQPTRRSLRCAIYTRVSTDQGLEQDFNSLDAQREASEAYVKSQAHEGWKQGDVPIIVENGGAALLALSR